MQKVHRVLGCGVLWSVGLLSLPLWAWAQGEGQPGFKRDFEDAKALSFQMVPGKASDGSTVEFSDEQAKSGKTSVKVHYQFTGNGYLQFLTPSPLVLPKTHSVQLSAWIYGNGLRAFNSAAIRFVDAHGETFQYTLNPDVANALNGDGWQQVKVEVNLAKPNGHWGDNSDGVPDLPMKFLGFAFDRSATEPAAGSVYFDDLEIRDLSTTNPVEAPAGAPITLSVQPVWNAPTPAIFIYAPGTQVSMQANIAVGGAAPNSGNRTLVWTARDFENKVVAQGKVPVQGQNTQWKLPAGAPGIWYLSAEVRDASDALLAKADSRVAFASLAKAPTPAVPLLWGVNSHPEHCTLEEVEREAALTAALGFTAIRGGMTNWMAVQPDNAQQWKWEKGDQMYAIFDRYQIKALQGFLGSPKWASSGDVNTKDWRDWGFAPPKNLDDLTNYLKAATQRYKKSAVAYEIWNEPDISFWRGTQEQYAKLYNASRDAIKAANPNAKVMNGGFSETKRQADFIPNFTKAAEKPDIFAYHTHQQFSNLVRAGDDVKGYLQNAKWTGTPVWLNEAGFSSAANLTERDQASALIKKFSYTAALGYHAYFWYDLRNDGNLPSDFEHNFGLVRRDFTPKAAAVAARTLIAQVGGKRFVKRLQAPAGVYALLFEGKNATGATESTAVVWNEASNGSEIPLFWKVPGKVAGISAMGTQAAIPMRGGVAITNAAPMPQFVTIAGSATGVSLAQKVMDFDGAVLAAPASSENWKLTLTNPLNEVWKGQIKLSGQDGWNASKPTIDFNIAARGTGKYVVPISAPAGAKMSSLKVELTSAALPTPVTAVARLLPASQIPRWASAGTLGDFSHWKMPVAQLGRSKIVSLFEATPMDNLHFHGDADLSANVYLAKVPTGLLLGVRVKDDHHVQNEAVGAEWQGDSVQFALTLPTGANYEWAASLAEAGARTTLYSAPSGVKTGAANLPVSIQRKGDETWYEVLIPNTLPGGPESLGDQFRFSLLVNDNDGAGRKGWVEWTPGIGASKDPTQYQPLVVQ